MRYSTFPRYSVLTILLLAVSSSFCLAQTTSVSGHLIVERASGSPHRDRSDNSNVVVWLTPKTSMVPASIPFPNAGPFTLTQKDKRFIPELLVVPVGSSIEFPNRDPFFHNVFSLFDGKRFDLGLYQAGETRSVRFDREGVSYIFCNIHPEMHAVVVALKTPLFSISDNRGNFSILNVPAGEYTMRIWSERAVPGSLESLQQTVKVSGKEVVVPALRLNEAKLVAEHKNKFGKDYDQTLPTPIY